MTSVEARLGGLTKDLTARERAILVMQRWLREEQWDNNLVWTMPPEQKDEYDRICRAIEDGNREFFSNAVVEQLWIFEDEIRLGWLEYAWAVEQRVARLEAALRSRKVKVRRSGKKGRARPEEIVLEPLPDPEHGMAWSMNPLYGQRAKDDGEPDPTGEEMVPALARAVRAGVERRWKDLQSIRVVLAEMSAAFDGYNATMARLDEALTMLLGRVEHIHAALQRFGPFPLPDVDEAALEVTRGWVRFDDIRGTAPTTAGGQQSESEYARKQREEANAKWREELEAERTRRDGESEDVFVTGAEV